jgi:hypothetical protein
VDHLELFEMFLAFSRRALTEPRVGEEHERGST